MCTMTSSRFSGLIGSGRISESVSCSWQSIIIGDQVSAVLLVVDKFSPAIGAHAHAPHESASPVVAVKHTVLVLKQERPLDLALEQRPCDGVPLTHRQSQNFVRLVDAAELACLRHPAAKDLTGHSTRCVGAEMAAGGEMAQPKNGSLMLFPAAPPEEQKGKRSFTSIHRAPRPSGFKSAQRCSRFGAISVEKSGVQ